MIRTSAMLAAALFLLPACGSDPAVEAAPEVAAEGADTKVLTSPAKDGFAEMAMDSVESGLASGDCVVYDANSVSTREESGVIPGAILLDNYRDYDLTALPAAKDATVVFYCGSTMCTASDKAAHRAQTAGYTDVRVMREGIKGWKKAGKSTVALADATQKSAG